MTAKKNLATQVTNTAKTLHADANIHSAYGFVDTTTLGTNMVSYWFSLTHTMEDTEVSSSAMYDWLRTPEGILSASLGIIPLALYSAFANSYCSSETTAGKALYRNWQAFRDSVKGLKNAFRGTKSTISAIRLLAAQDYTYLLMPLGLFFGLLSMGNRAWNRNMVNMRKDLKDDNKALIRALEEWGSFRLLTSLPENNDDLAKHKNGFRIIPKDDDPSQNELYYISYDYENKKAKSHCLNLTDLEIKMFLSRLKTSEDTNPLRPSILQWRRLLPGIAETHYAAFHQAITSKTQKNHQSKKTQRLAYASQTYAGFIDGLYMFMGLIAVTAMSANVLFAVSGVSIFFAAACILTRLHEEKDYQNDLLISQQKTELALSAKTVEIELAKLLEIQWELINREKTLPPFERFEEWQIKQKDLVRLQKEGDKALNAARGQFNAIREKLFQSHKISTTDAVLVGLRHALAAYTALVCSVFAVALVSLLLFATPLPEMVALCTVAVGVVLLVGSTIYALSMAKTHQANQEKHFKYTEDTIYQFIENKKNKPEAVLFQEFPRENTKQKTPSLSSLGLDFAMPVYALLCWTDIFRSFFSGMLKAFKFVFFGLSLLASPEPSQHDNTLLWALAIPTAILFSLIFALRSAAKHCKDLFGNQNTAGDANQKKRSQDGSEMPKAENDRLDLNPSVAHDAAKNEHLEAAKPNDSKKSTSEDKISPTNRPTSPRFFDEPASPPQRRSSGSALPSTLPSIPSSLPSSLPFFPNPRAGKRRASSEGDDSNAAIKAALNKINASPIIAAY